MERANTILVIENDPEIANAISVAVARIGCEVVGTSNGIDGLEKGKELRPDLVVLDMLLPGMDGLEVAHRLKLVQGASGPPILMISSKARATDRSAARQVGVARFVAKPLDFEEVAIVAEELLADAHGTPEYAQVQDQG